MIDHVSIQCADLAASAAFYDAVLAPLGGRRIMEFDEASSATARRSRRSGSAASTPATGFRESHLAFQAPDRDAVRRVPRRRPATGRRGAPRARVWPEYHPGYFGAFVRDPDGNNVEAVHHTF